MPWWLKDGAHTSSLVLEVSDLTEVSHGESYKHTCASPPSSLVPSVSLPFNLFRRVVLVLQISSRPPRPELGYLAYVL